MTTSELSIWGDIANIVIAVASVATAIVTARMLIKQHNLQKEQHKLDQSKHDLELQKFEAQKQEHQPIFHFRRLDDCLEICNSGEKLAQPIKFRISSMAYIYFSIFHFSRIIEYVTCVPVKIYRECKCQDELDGVVARCHFNKDERELLHKKCTEVVNSLVDDKQIQMRVHPMSGVVVRDSELIAIEYTDVYKQTHRLFYKDSIPITGESYEKIMQAMMQVSRIPLQIDKIDVESIKRIVLQFRTIKNW